MSLLDRITKSLFGGGSTTYKGYFAGLPKRVRIDHNQVIEAETNPGEWQVFHNLPKGERAWFVATTWEDKWVGELLARWDTNLTKIEEMNWKVVGVKLAEPREDALRVALKDLVDASEPMVGDAPAPARDSVELRDARKRALKVLEGQP